jgi:acyl carrier protein
MDKGTAATGKRLSDASMVSKIGEIVARIRKNPALAEKITGSTDFINEIGLDSLKMIDFLLAFEEEFQIQVDFNALAKLRALSPRA